MTTKRCSVCGQPRPPDAFNGARSWCRGCRTAYQRRYDRDMRRAVPAYRARKSAIERAYRARRREVRA